jgi:hypothetical protein
MRNAAHDQMPRFLFARCAILFTPSSQLFEHSFWSLEMAHLKISSCNKSSPDRQIKIWSRNLRILLHCKILIHQDNLNEQKVQPFCVGVFSSLLLPWEIKVKRRNFLWSENAIYNTKNMWRSLTRFLFGDSEADHMETFLQLIKHNKLLDDNTLFNLTNGQSTAINKHWFD